MALTKVQKEGIETLINNNADNRVITGSGTANTLNGESSLTWNGSAMGVGLSSPSDTLHVFHATDNLVARFESGDTGGGITLKDNTHVTSLLTTNGAFEINVDQGSDISGETIAFKMSGSEKMRIDSSGRVGIGATSFNDSAEYLLVKNDGTAANISIVASNDAHSSLNLGDEDDFNIQKIRSDHTNNSLQLFTDNAERMRIDSSGNVAIARSSADARLHIDTSHYVVTNSGISTTGIHLDGTHGNAGEYGGGISFGCGGDGSAAIAARQASASQHRVGLSFFTHDSTSSSANAVEKVRLHDSGEVSFNNGICLGNSLTLSASHNLNDYEEGTWTPALNSGNSNLTNSYGRYVKIGTMVYAFWHIHVASNGSSSHLILNNLPFTSKNAEPSSGGTAKDYQTYDVQDGPIYHIPKNATQIQFYKNSGQNFAESNGSNLDFRGCSIYQSA